MATLIYDDELGYIELDPTAAGGIRIIAPPGPPPPHLVAPPANAPTAPAPAPPGVTESPVEVDDDYAAELELSRFPTEDDLIAEELERLELDVEEEERGGEFFAVDPRVRFGGGVDAHLSRALGCGACSFRGPRDMRGSGRGCALRCWQSNNAVDIMAPVTFAVRAVRAGVVSSTLGWGLNATSGGTAGYRLHLVHPDGMKSWYTHLGPKIAARGRRVAQGDVIGFIARWPSFAPHVHFAVTPPWNPETMWQAVVSRTGRDRTPPPAPPPVFQPVPQPISPAERRTYQQSWLGLMRAIGEDRRDARRTIDAAKRAIGETLR